MDCCRCGNNPNENVIEPNVQDIQAQPAVQPPLPLPPLALVIQPVAAALPLPPVQGSRPRFPRRAQHQESYSPNSQPIYPNYGEGILDQGALGYTRQFIDNVMNPEGTNGVCALKEIKKGVFVGDYIGIEVDQIVKERLVRRGEGGYLMDLGFHEVDESVHYWMNASDRENANILSSINNSCVKEHINVEFVKYYKNGTNGGIACLGAFATRDIKRHENVFFCADHTLIDILVPERYRKKCFCLGFQGQGANRQPICETIMP